MREQRIAALEQMLSTDPNDAFALYGLALEHKADGRLEDALPLLRRALVSDSTQVYTYYQLGEVLMALDEPDDARAALEEGIAVATRTGDAKAVNELHALLALL